MKEIDDILAAYAIACKEGQRAALATVVKVEGSSYRRPGARMLVTEDGRLTGAISGGCLEGDARRKALFAIEQNQNRLVTYDSMDEDGELFGIQLGCNGIVHILFEPIASEAPHHPLSLLEKVAQSEAPACLVTLFNEKAPHGPQTGSCLLVQEAMPAQGHVLEAEARRVLARQASEVIARDKQSALFDYIPPSPSLVIAGAGNDAMPLARFAQELGWQVTVIDGRATHATRARFPTAREVRIVKAGEALPAANAYILMSHNYPYDLACLKALMPMDCSYIGLLGPAAKRERMGGELGPLSSAQLQKLYGPAGLDLGAETAEEIALSIIAEIKAVLMNTHGAHLRDKRTFIHHRARA